MQNDPQQAPQVEPRQVKTQKKRHGCLTAWLTFMILGLTFVIFYNLLYLGEIEVWGLVATIIIGVLEVVCIVALFRWKRWGFWGICGLAVIGVVINLISGVGAASFSGLIGVALLYAVLQIGGENKGWSQLE